MSNESKASGEKAELEFALAEAELKYRVLKEKVDLTDQLQKRLFLSLGFATKKLETSLEYTMQERKMKQNIVYNQYFKVCDAIITLCKSF
jgi:hypothetical protein